MFNNYKELFHGYVDFYRTSLFHGSPVAGSRSPECGQLCAQDEFAFQQTLAANSNNYSHLLAASEPQQKGAAELLLLNQDPRLVVEGTRVLRIGSFNSLDRQDLAYIGSIFLFLVLAKRLLSNRLRNLKQLDKLGLRAKDRERMDESIWRLIYYSFSSVWLIYSCLEHDSHLFLTTRAPFYDFRITWSTYTIYMIEAAFYLHATYALIFEDVWRRDSPMMLVHHLAAVFTTLSIYATRTHQIGLVSTVLRDTCDVLLEVTKLTKCLHIQHGQRVRSLGITVNCFLSVFALVFFVNQLYYFPLYCLYHGLNMIKLFNLHTPVMVGILTCGLLFLLLDCLWFCLILRLIYYMAMAKPMKDLREYDDEDDDILESTDEKRHGRELEQTTRKDM